MLNPLPALRPDRYMARWIDGLCLDLGRLGLFVDFCEQIDPNGHVKIRAAG